MTDVLIREEPPPVLPRLGVRVEIEVTARNDRFAGEVVRIPRGPFGWAVVVRTDAGAVVWATRADLEQQRKTMRLAS